MQNEFEAIHEFAKVLMRSAGSVTLDQMRTLSAQEIEHLASCKNVLAGLLDDIDDLAVTAKGE